MSISIADIKNALWSTAAAARLKTYLDSLIIVLGGNGDISTQAAGDSAAGGSSAKVARADHKHGFPSTMPPTAHASAHVTGGGDVIAAAVSGGNAGLMTGADKLKLDGLTAIMIIKGDLACAGNPNYPAGTVGDAHYVSSAGLVGGGAGVAVEIGDTIVCKTDNAGGDQAAVGADWFVLEHNIDSTTLPTANQKAALAGTSGTAPSASNKLVDDADTRLLAAANLAKVISNVATIAQGANSVAVAMGSGAYDGKPVVAMFKTPSLAITMGASGYLAGSIVFGTLTIEHIGKDNVASVLANAQDVYYIIDGR